MEVRDKKNMEYKKFLSDAGADDYTEYFIRSRSFALIDEFLNRGREKYTEAQLLPKGILLGKISLGAAMFFLGELWMGILRF